MFVDFGPQLIAGQVRLGTSLITGAWRRNPVLSGSYQLVRSNEVTVFDSFAQDAGSTVFPNIRHTLQRNFINSALGTTFLVEGGRSYVFGVIARAWVSHNVTSNTGRPIPQDATRFRLYARDGVRCPVYGGHSAAGPRSLSARCRRSEPLESVRRSPRAGHAADPVALTRTKRSYLGSHRCE